MKTLKLEVTLVLAGLPRYQSDLPALLARYKNAGVSQAYGFFWDYKGRTPAATTNQASSFTEFSIDREAVSDSGFLEVKTALPIAGCSLPFNPAEHEQVGRLGLKPNFLASKSWLTALARGAALLVDAADTNTSDFWIITRSDLRFSSRSLRRLLLTLAVDSRFDETTIAVAARKKAHRVLNIDGNHLNLPIDHFFIGRPSAMAKFADLSQVISNLEQGKDCRQPVVNEFLIGQFLADNGLSEFPVGLPYLIWRGGIYDSLVGFGRGRFGAFMSAISKLLWLLRGFLRPGLHKAGL